MLKVGSRSLLFGAHQFIIHPLFVFVAWNKIYKGAKPPGIFHRLLVAIVHDWGYWGCSTMDGPCGDHHSILGANLAFSITGSQWLYEEALCHSRFFAKRMGMTPSNFCWVDKYATVLYPSWLWVTLCYLSGEGWEYLENSMYEIHVPGETRTWVNLYRFHQRLRGWTKTILNGYGWEVK